MKGSFSESNSCTKLMSENETGCRPGKVSPVTMCQEHLALSVYGKAGVHAPSELSVAVDLFLTQCQITVMEKLTLNSEL